MNVSGSPYGLSGLIKNDLQKDLKDSISVMVSGEDLAHLIPMVSICQGMSTLVKQDLMLSISLDWISINAPRRSLSVHRYSGSSIAVSVALWSCAALQLLRENQSF